MMRNFWLKTGQFILLFAYACGMQGQNFDEMVNKLIIKSVPLIQPDSLIEVLKKQSDIVILDVRENNEYEVSHIENAIWVGYKNFDLEKLEIPKNKQIVVYCSVGYRSEKIGEKLQDAGYHHVNNLYGGIFKWTNEGNVVYDQSDQPTNKVHAYSESWGKWIVKGEKVYD